MAPLQYVEVELSSKDAAGAGGIKQHTGGKAQAWLQSPAVQRGARTAAMILA
ncbi:hypothetical protein MNEG_8225, partial [Monoraphidium neglectum]